MFKPRPKQQEVLNYTSGKMGVSAVPGSGKTVTLSYLAAQLVASGLLEDDQEVLVVTLVNSAVDHFAGRVADFVQQRGLLPHLGYRVRTLHGLAHDIVRERPALVGLSDDFQIVDERAADQIRQDAAEAWLRSNPYAADDFLAFDLDEGKRDWVRRDQWPRLVSDIALSFIRQAKDLQITPAELRDSLDRFPQPLPLVEMGWAIYHDYQRALVYRGAVDFDDLIRLALWALKLDEEYLERLRDRWPFVLEDEAQDSSRLQEEILRLLVGPDPSTALRRGSGQGSGQGGNWVRVGDPNQAIYETFTTASPEFLRAFLEEADVEPRELPNSGRSTQSIINLANYLMDWTQRDHPIAAVRGALSPPHIEPTPPGDPQPNPSDDPSQVHLVAQKFSPKGELQAVADSLASWLPEHPDETVAVLVPRNDRGFAMVNELKKRGLEYVEFLRSTRATREAAGALGNIVSYLADPTSPTKLATVYKVWRRQDREDEEARAHLESVVKMLRKCRQVEDFLWPRVDRDWLDDLELADEASDIGQQLVEFRELVRRWQGATLLPIDQLILTLAQDLFQEPADLAVAHKLAVVLRQASESHPDWRLPELTQELAVVARNERRFLGFSDDDTGFDPERHKGKVVVATIHKAKGLEWDRVYLMSVNNYDFPSALPHDEFISERWFVRDRLNLEAEALAQLEALFPQDAVASYEEGEATQEARLDYAAERLRLLYVGITRAKKELIITWNSGRPNRPQQQAVPFIALQTFWEGTTEADRLGRM
ncbi:MAG: UvrD-helicase domain-containing protein [Anaerolineae bacterium]|nr:UvrD-helicase domain-containing protein [Anaerolineae bacterium]